MTDHSGTWPLLKPLGVKRLFWARCRPEAGLMARPNGGNTATAPHVVIRDPLVASGLVDILTNAPVAQRSARGEVIATSGHVEWSDDDVAVVSEVTYQPFPHGQTGGQLVGLPARLMAQCPPSGEGWVVLLLLQDDGGTVLAFFRSEEDVVRAFGDVRQSSPRPYRSPVRDIRGCIEDEQARTGFVDYLAGTRVCSSLY